MEIIESRDIALAAAKGKGCSASISFGVPQRTESIFMAGVGVASPSIVAPKDPLTFAYLNANPVVAMEWLSNRMFGVHPELGEISAVFRTVIQKKGRSNAVIYSDKIGRLLPAKIVNTLFIEISIPSIGLKMANLDPLVLTSDSVVMSGEIIARDPRVIRNPAGLPKYEKMLIDGGAATRFLASGVHEQLRPIGMFTEPDEIQVAHLENASVTVMPHYGIEVSLVDHEFSALGWIAELIIENLTDRKLNLRWFCDVLNKLKLTGARSGRFLLDGKKTKKIRLRGIILSEMEVMDTHDVAMFSVCNVSINAAEFVSGYIALNFRGGPIMKKG